MNYEPSAGYHPDFASCAAVSFDSILNLAFSPCLFGIFIQRRTTNHAGLAGQTQAYPNEVTVGRLNR